ncbi:MAG: 50S ribosomal protein L22 [Mycoplasmoidaceae bacterium]|nr:50S ribosomal protein L22 [Mycoplasmoidaceae bacterium]
MKSYAIQRNIRISSSKAKLVCDLIRGKKVKQALVILDNTNKKIAPIIKKLLNSAIANATNNKGFSSVDNLYIYSIVANQGPTMKRALPRAKGSSNMIRKRTSHIEIVLSDDPKQKQKDLLEVKTKLAKKVQKINRPAVKVEETKKAKPAAKKATENKEAK